MDSPYARLRSTFVGLVYADHNRRPSVRAALHGVIESIPETGIGLNVGAGPTRIDPRVVSLDLLGGSNLDVIASAVRLPFGDGSFDVVVTQETMEHVDDPFAALGEIERVLKPGGVLYLQLPFVIGYHPGPTDFWRFTREGMRQVVEQAGLHCREVGVAVGASSGFYRIAVEYFAILFSSLARSLYMPLKAFFAAVLYPVKLLDVVTDRSPQVDRIAGGYFVIADKADVSRSVGRGSQG